METANLTVVCTIAFAVVFAVLALLALLIQLVTWLVPERAMEDRAPYVAIASAVAALLPEGRVVRIEEES